MRLGYKGRESGSVLVVTLVLSAILGTTLAGYLYWVRTQNVLVAQSQAWNQALAMAEAGIEEGMAQINHRYGTNYGDSALANWGLSGGIYGPRFADFNNRSYSAIIIPASPGPTIIATGYATVPLLAKPVKRVVRVTTKQNPAFGVAIFARQNITMAGNRVMIDSYDSGDSAYSTDGRFDPAKRKAGGDVASAYGAVNVGNAEVHGKVRTGPEGTFAIGTQGLVGDLSFAGPGVQEGWLANDFNTEIKEVQAPDASAFLAPSAVAGDTNKYLLGSGGYILNGDLEVKSGETVRVSGNAILYVTGDVRMSGLTSAINIDPGSQLVLYVAGANANFSRINTTGLASSFQYYGLPTNNKITWNGNDAYVGVIYAPYAHFICGGGGSSIFDFQGSCVIDFITLNGHFKVHYDEALRRSPLISGYVVDSWREL